jgi:hypothetical protein
MYFQTVGSITVIQEFQAISDHYSIIRQYIRCLWQEISNVSVSMEIIRKYLKPFKAWLILAMGLTCPEIRRLKPFTQKIFDKDKKGLYYAMWRQQIGEIRT